MKERQRILIAPQSRDSSLPTAAWHIGRPALQVVSRERQQRLMFGVALDRRPTEACRRDREHDTGRASRHALTDDGRDCRDPRRYLVKAINGRYIRRSAPTSVAIGTSSTKAPA